MGQACSPKTEGDVFLYKERATSKMPKENITDGKIIISFKINVNLFKG